MALTNQQHFDRLGIPLADRPGHTAACPRFGETFPWLCNCQAKAAEASAEQALADLAARDSGVSLEEARAALGWTDSNLALGRALAARGFIPRKVQDGGGCQRRWFPTQPRSFTISENPIPALDTRRAPFYTKKVALDSGRRILSKDLVADHRQVLGEADEQSLLKPDDRAATSGLIGQLDADMLHAIGRDAPEADIAKRKDLYRVHDDSPSDNRGTLARRRIESIDPALRRRLRPTVSMVSGPNVLRQPQRWRGFHLRADRDRFGDTGPARLPWWQAGAVALLLRLAPRFLARLLTARTGTLIGKAR